MRCKLGRTSIAPHPANASPAHPLPDATLRGSVCVGRSPIVASRLAGLILAAAVVSIGITISANTGILCLSSPHTHPHPGEVKNLPPSCHGGSRDSYIVIALDQEEIFRTATVEKNLK